MSRFTIYQHNKQCDLYPLYSAAFVVVAVYCWAWLVCVFALSWTVLRDTLNRKFSVAFSIIGMFSSHAVSTLSIFFCAEITPTVIRWVCTVINTGHISWKLACLMLFRKYCLLWLWAQFWSCTLAPSCGAFMTDRRCATRVTQMWLKCFRFSPVVGEKEVCHSLHW